MATWQFTTNQTPTTTGNGMWTFITTLVTAGWLVKADSDGTTYNSSGGQVTGGGTGAHGLGNNLAWIRIQAPDAAHEFTFQNLVTAGDGNWRVKYSASAHFTGGSPGAGQTPTSTDQIILNGTASESSPVSTSKMFNGTTGSNRWNMAADSSSPYGAWLVTFPNGGGNPNGGFLFDAMKSGSYQSGDTDPYIACSRNSTSTMFGGASSDMYIAMGINGTNYTPATTTYLFPPGTPAVTSWSSNPYTGKYDLFPVFYYQASVTYKGTSNYLNWFTGSKTTPTPLDASTLNDTMLFGSMVFPWNGTTITI